METPEPKPDDSDAEIDRVCSVLETISRQYADGSPEYRALEDAALALMAVRQHQAASRAYQRLRAAFNGKLTEEAIAKLREHGIEPGDFDSDL